MSLLQEVTLERLWSKYENKFGAPPPIANAGFDEAISLIREKLHDGPADRTAGAAADGNSDQIDIAFMSQVHGGAAAYRPDTASPA